MNFISGVLVTVGIVAMVALLLFSVAALLLAIVSRVNDQAEDRDEEPEEDEHVADLPQVPPPQVDFSSTRLFND